MALNKHEKEFCGPTESIRNVLRPDEKEKAQMEVLRINESHPRHFLFTPNLNGGKINEQEARCPNLSKLFRTFVPDGQSLICAFQNGAGFALFVEDLLMQVSKTYSELLVKHSVRLVPTKETAYTLSGGSFAGVGLALNEQRWKITKTIQRGFGDVDADVRLLAEGKFIAGLPAEVKGKFPIVEADDIIEQTDLVGYRMEYCPYPTVAELVLSGHISGEQTVEALSTIYREMFSAVYCLPEGSEKKDDNYFERIDRRMKRVLETPEHIGRRLKRLLTADKLRIDGKDYEGFSNLYERLKANDEHRNLAIPPDHCVAHGDMILEDMLLNPYSNDFKLIDPNGRSHSRYYDLAKTLLSLSTKYELFYFNQFRLEFDSKDETDIHIVFDDPKMSEQYGQMAEAFWQFLEEEEGLFFAEDPQWKDRLMLLNALQNLAIVMFHLIRHNQEDRATAFLLMGVKQLTAFFEKQN